MAQVVLQIGFPRGAELSIMLSILVIMLIPTILVYWDASRRETAHQTVWAVATFLAAPTIFGIAAIGVLYYFLVVREPSAEER